MSQFVQIKNQLNIVGIVQFQEICVHSTPGHPKCIFSPVHERRELFLRIFVFEGGWLLNLREKSKSQFLHKFLSVSLREPLSSFQHD